MAQLPGKKVGTIDVVLERDRGYRQGKGRIVKDLRLDSDGTFHAYHDGVHFKSKTQADLREQLRAAIERAVDLVWDRYLVIEYQAKAWPLQPGTNRTAEHGSYISLELGDDRDVVLWRDPSGHRDANRLDRAAVITDISLRWDVVEFSRPFAVPESDKPIRSRREIYYNSRSSDSQDEHLGDPREERDDSLPAGAVLWTAEREALLCEVRRALGEVDRRLSALFGGTPEDLAGTLDAAALAGPGRLLAAPLEAPSESAPPEPAPPKIVERDRAPRRKGR